MVACAENTRKTKERKKMKSLRICLLMQTRSRLDFEIAGDFEWYNKVCAFGNFVARKARKYGYRLGEMRIVLSDSFRRSYPLITWCQYPSFFWYIFNSRGILSIPIGKIISSSSGLYIYYGNPNEIAVTWEGGNISKTFMDEVMQFKRKHITLVERPLEEYYRLQGF